MNSAFFFSQNFHCVNFRIGTRKNYPTNAQNLIGSSNICKTIFWEFFQAMFESPDEIGLAEPKESPHKL